MVTGSAVDEGEAPCAADGERLVQVIAALIDNGLKFWPSRTVPVRVEVSSDEGGATVVVSDGGIGIAPVDLPHVFDKFFRVDAMMSGGTGGTGIGLYLARRLVTAMGGTIEVASTEGRGSRFTIRLQSPPHA